MSDEISLEACGRERWVTFVDKLKSLTGQQVTVYLKETNLSGMLYSVGMNYLELILVSNGVISTAFVYLYEILAVVPGAALNVSATPASGTVITP